MKRFQNKAVISLFKQLIVSKIEEINARQSLKAYSKY